MLKMMVEKWLNILLKHVVEDFIDLEMDKLEVNVYKNGEFLSTGNGSAVQGHPACPSAPHPHILSIRRV